MSEHGETKIFKRKAGSGFFGLSYRVRNGRLVVKQEEDGGNDREGTESRLSFAKRCELAKGLAFARKIQRVFNGTAFVEKEMAFFHFGYGPDTEPFVFEGPLAKSFQNCEEVAEKDNALGPWTEDQAVSQLIGNIEESLRDNEEEGDEGNDEEENEEKSEESEGEHEASLSEKLQALKDLDRALSEFKPTLWYASADGNNCDNLVEALYVNLADVTAGILIFKSW